MATFITFFGYGIVQIIITIIMGTITGCSIAAGFDIWKRIKAKFQNRKNSNYINNLEANITI